MTISNDYSISFKAALFLVLINIATNQAGWIDPDTKISDKFVESFVDRRSYELVFSDEFEKEGRTFKDGEDPRWTSINKDDYTNFALHYYNSDLAKTNSGLLNISTIIEDVTFSIDAPEKAVKKVTKNYQSGMIQGWNKFCFTGGIVEISAQLPGKWDVGGLWPAMWLLGNLARATYVGSSNNVWPWSYDTCSKDLQYEQAFSACNRVEHYDLHPKKGRGAPEIDILEAMGGREALPSTTVGKPYFSTSFQVAPGIENYRPTVAERPQPGLWYDHDIEYAPGNDTDLNVFFYGMTLEGARPELSYLADAISANTNLKETHFKELHKYRLEWIPGEEGYIKWYLDDTLLFGINANALNKTGAIIPEEPMYLIINTAISSTWGFPQPCPDGCACDCFDVRKRDCECAIPPKMGEQFPAFFLIDYVRVYQAVGDDDQIVGCSTPSHPSSRYIKGHLDKFMSEKDTEPLQEVKVGGQRCIIDSDCGGEGYGECVRNTCKCEAGYVGPRCLAAKGFDSILWETPESMMINLMFIPWQLLVLAIVLVILLGFVVAYKVKSDRDVRGGWRLGAMGRYTKVVEMERISHGGRGGPTAGSSNTQLLTPQYSNAPYNPLADSFQSYHTQPPPDSGPQVA